MNSDYQSDLNSSQVAKMSLAMEKDAHELLQDVIKDADRVSTNKLYTNWAPTYEKDMAAVRYFGPTQLMDAFGKLNVPKDAKILDFGAGTGAIGRELVKQGYSDLHAVDGSEGMLASAKKEGNYKSYTHLLFEPNSKLPFDDKIFDCVLLAGVFAPGHLPIVALREACRVTKIGGKVAWNQCDPDYYAVKDIQYANRGFQNLVKDIEDKGLWKCCKDFPIKVPYIEYSDGFIQAFEVIG